MNRGRVGEERGGKETDGCPLTDATEEVSLYVSHGKCTLNQHTNLVSGFWEQNSL
jgi:hypothetical protein